jgi:fructokinase
VNEPLLFGGIEGGGTKFICAVGRAGGALLDEASIPTTDSVTTLAACLRFFEAARARHGAIAALGVACFGPLQLDPRARDFGCLMATPKAGWSGAPVVAPLHSALGVPVALDTDVAAAALAEWQLGAGRGLGSLAYVTVGTGIGGAIVPKSAGVSLMHAEMGHVPLRRDARDATFAGICPFHADCAEGLASGPAIRARWGVDLDQLPAEHPGRDIIAGYLGQLAATIALVASPRRIVMGGGVMADATMLSRVRKAMSQYLQGYLPPVREASAIDAYLAAPGLGTRSGINGALLLAQGATRQSAQ